MNACGLAVVEEGSLIGSLQAAYDSDPLSAFGGILAANRIIGKILPKLIKEQKLFMEVIVAPDFSERALAIIDGEKKLQNFKI